MYTHNRTGTRHKVDINSSLVNVTGTVTTTPQSDPLKVHLDTANLASKQQAYTSVRHLNAGVMARETQVAYGVALTPLNTFQATDRPMYLEITCALSFAPNQVAHFPTTAFIGYSDGSSVQSGWQNPVTNFHCIPTQRSDSAGIYVRESVLLMNINSATFDHDKPLIAGFRIGNPTDSERGLYNIIFSLSARYSRQKIVTQDLTR